MLLPAEVEDLSRRVRGRMVAVGAPELAVELRVSVLSWSLEELFFSVLVAVVDVEERNVWNSIC